ncbi:fused MFS/spermidine synthase [Herbaspirillum sp.]|uniref:spermidine synthase n=1 Tax=Herbaspirillum sp. TaxID=1890675 RepID=UPI001B0506C6|nr:fused MFS/spermidine synthase [Herbaspirillum sp.]MBO9536358.1 fused MFS/spermidine synthase [Herbaspirillum sp.]
MNIIYESESVKIVEVLDSDGDTQRQLYIGPPFNRVQGTIKLNKPRFHVHVFTKNISYAALCVPQGVRNALFLGLGAGIAIQTVRDAYPEAQIDVVDLNRDLFDAAHNHFFSLDADNVELFHEDAFSFIRRATRKYDYICCDIWTESLDIPEFVVSGAFSSQVKASLNPGGVFALNTQKNVQKEMTESLTKDFKNLFSLPGYNSMFLASDAWPAFIQDEKMIAHYLELNIDINFIHDNMILMQSARTHGLSPR